MVAERTKTAERRTTDAKKKPGVTPRESAAEQRKSENQRKKR
jgi:hypothetical protein